MGQTIRHMLANVNKSVSYNYTQFAGAAIIAFFISWVGQHYVDDYDRCTLNDKF